MYLHVTNLTLIAIWGLLSPFARAAQPEASFDLHVPVAPIVRSVDGVSELVYELHLDNFATRDLKPLRVEVLDAANDRSLAVYEGHALDQRLDLSGMQWRAEAYTAIPSGRRGVMFIELSGIDPMPKALRHRIAYMDTSSPGSDVRLVEGGDTAIVSGWVRVLSPPLIGGPWVAVCDARWKRGHRRVGYAIDGKLRTPGRYAVDWVKLDSSGRKSPAEPDVAARTYSHGQDVLAVADGVIVYANDQAAERARISEKPISILGNSVVLKLDSGEFVHYGHLRPGSAARAQGARVKAGDKIAEVGLSGSASDPQLHFALTDGQNELASEGIAYVFDHYRLLGKYGDVSQLESMPWTPVSSEKATEAAMPSCMSVVHFAIAGMSLTTLSAVAASSAVDVVAAKFAAVNRHDIAAIIDLYGPDVVIIASNFCAPRHGRSDVQRTYEGIFAALPDAQAEILEYVSEGDRVAVRYVVRSRSAGASFGIPILNLFTVRDGLITRDEGRFDNGGRACTP